VDSVPRTTHKPTVQIEPPPSTGWPENMMRAQERGEVRDNRERNEALAVSVVTLQQKGESHMADTTDEVVATGETGSLIAASKVNETKVYNTQGDHLGSIYDVMIDKRSGQVAYAVMALGGFLGMGKDYHPLPWSMLTYDTSQGGYVVDLDKDRLEGAPTYSESDADAWDDPDYARGIDDYYGR
jgi:sporulation protein YlmC with PRC-barrel domain